MDTTTPIVQIPIAEHNLEVGRFFFYPNIVVGEFNEGVHVTYENATIPIQIATEIYGGEVPIVYISHRLHSYAMDPVGYKEVVELFPNFKAFGIVAESKRRRMLANLERLFIKKPIRVFSNLDDALKWAETIVEQAN